MCHFQEQILREHDGELFGEKHSSPAKDEFLSPVSRTGTQSPVGGGSPVSPMLLLPLGAGLLDAMGTTY